ncbi:MAG: DUF354 domain-containing protein [Ignavibacteriaceae bacterium]
MKIFIDIGHPAHVHYFKYLIRILKSRDYNFFITARNKEMTQYLLNKYELDYVDRGKGSDSFWGKLYNLFKANKLLLIKAKAFKPDLFISFASPYAAQTSKMLGIPSITFDDTESARFGHLMYKNFTSCILTPDCFEKNFGGKHLKFAGYMELSYLHSNYFKHCTSIFKFLDLNDNEPYVLLRFVSWSASHDFGLKGISIENKIKAVEKFSEFGKVFITAENNLPQELEKYKIEIPPELIHHVIYYASLLLGESATMASEAAVLGTPAIYIDNIGRGYTKEQENKFGLVFNYTSSESDQEKAINKGIELLKNKNLEEKFQKRRQKMLSDKIDVTAFMVWFIENYPESFKIMKENPDYQYRFK